MSRSMHRHRNRRTAVIHGDTADDVKNYGGLAANAILEAASMGLKKTAADKAAKPMNDAQNAAKSARMKANTARIDAQTAKAKADAAEPNAGGPMHTQAQALARSAALAEADAQSAEAKAAMLSGSSGGSQQGAAMMDMRAGGGYAGGEAASMFSMRNILIAAGVVLGGAVAFKLMRRS